MRIKYRKKSKAQASLRLVESATQLRKLPVGAAVTDDLDASCAWVFVKIEDGVWIRPFMRQGEPALSETKSDEQLYHWLGVGDCAGVIAFNPDWKRA